MAQCSLDGLRDRLPLLWPAPPDTPPSPKKYYRSHYVYPSPGSGQALGWEDPSLCSGQALQDLTAWEHLSDFDLLLRLLDYTPLRPVLAQLLGWTSTRGQVPFDPVSIFLLTGWQITNKWNRADTLRNLRKPCYADYAQRFGFQNGIFPTEGGLRYWLTTIGRNSTSEETVLVDEDGLIEVAIQRLNQLLAQSVALFVEAGLLSPEALKKAFICPDGMIHDAASRLRCASVTDTCYQPTSPHHPRPCPAQEKERQGCDCDTTACAQVCRYATPRDPQARFVYYSGSNRTTDNPNQSTDPAQANKKPGEARFGYRTIPLQLPDPIRRFSLVLLDDFLPANDREEIPATALLLQLPIFYPDLEIYALQANGFDFHRQRHKWACFHTCRSKTTPIAPVAGATYPPDECPYLDHPYGQLINLGERFKDGSIRLVRDIPVGTPAWKRIYHRARNAAEGRHSAFESWGLKRLPVYGDLRGKALTFQADAWLNLTTLARLIREATAATGA